MRTIVKAPKSQGFALVITLALMVLLALLTVGLLGLATVEIRSSSMGAARTTARANARLGITLAIAELQKELGDDRRISADASIFENTQNPHAVGVWNAWSADLGAITKGGTTPQVNYDEQKGQEGFRKWLASASTPDSTTQLSWHENAAGAGDSARLFTMGTSGFDLNGEKVPVAASASGPAGTVAWAVTQENTKARINIGADEQLRVDPLDHLQAPTRPNLANSAYLKQPVDNEWFQRAIKVSSLSQAALDPAYGADIGSIVTAARDYTTTAASLLTDPVHGGVKVDLNTGFELDDTDFQQNSWSDSWGTLSNPFRSNEISQYKGQRPLYQPVQDSALLTVNMDFAPASVLHKFNVNGVPTFDMLREHYRIYRHLYTSSGKITAFERPYSHVAIPDKVSRLPYGEKTQSGLTPVLDRVAQVFSIYCKDDGTLCLLDTPFVTIWNPYNVAIECEGLVVYPWIDTAISWNYLIRTKEGKTHPWNDTLARLFGEGYEGHGRSSRPYFYLHLTQDGKPATGSSTINPLIRLEPGEVRMFCLAEYDRRDLEIMQSAQARTWRMKAVQNANDIVAASKSGIVLNFTKTTENRDNFNYQLQEGDHIIGQNISFNRSDYYYIMNMADSWQIKNPNTELMVQTRPAWGSFPKLPATPNLVFYSQIHAGPSFSQSNNTFSYPTMSFKQVQENPQMVGSVYTYHRTALSGSTPVADLMFTTNPRQPYVTPYLAGPGSRFQTGPHYETFFQGGTSLAALTMETTTDGRNAFYGPSHSASKGLSHLPFFDVPRSPILSMGGLQHADLTATAFGVSNQIGNSWASPYLNTNSVVNNSSKASSGEDISPMLGFYDTSYLANEALFDEFFFSGAAPITNPSSGSGSPNVWKNDQVSESKSVTQVLSDFFENPSANPLRNPKMKPWSGSFSTSEVLKRLEGPARAARLAAHLIYEGGFNVNSTSVEAWTAILSGLRGLEPASGNKTPASRFRTILDNMTEDDQWNGFRTLSDNEIKTLAEEIVKQVRLRGPFLSLGEFVNRQVANTGDLSTSGALQAAIDNTGLNEKFTYSSFDTS